MAYEGARGIYIIEKKKGKKKKKKGERHRTNIFCDSNGMDE
jgi:hypothetical protein